MKASRHGRGVSLIELMIAMAIAMVLLLGLVEVFAASRTAYQMAEGLSRVQENGRFAMDFLQRDLRMAGHMGCVNDQARYLTNPIGFRNALDAPDHPELDFATSIQGFEAAGTKPGDPLTLATGAWAGVPALPAYFQTLSPAPIAGSDILVLRFFSPEAVPVVDYVSGASTTITVNKASWDSVIASNGYTDTTTGLVAIADCLNATVFQVTSGPNASGVMQVAASGLNAGSLATDTYTQGQAMLYRAESAVFYIGMNGNGEPSLYRARFAAGKGTAAIAQVGGQPEELVSGIETMQLLYGTDSETNETLPPTGYIANQDVATAATPWRRVGLVQVAFLARSTQPASAEAPASEGKKPTVLGVVVTPPNDRRLRTVYESTVALRNRLYGN